MIHRYIDFDGVLFNTNEILENMLLEVGIDYTMENQEKVRNFISNVDFYRLIKNAKEINNAINNLLALMNNQIYKTAILTHVNSIQEGIDKKKFMYEVSDKILVIPVPKHIQKCHYVNPINAILIDDWKGNLTPWEESKGLPIHFDLALKKSEFPVINNLLDIDEVIEKNYKKVLRMSNKK